MDKIKASTAEIKEIASLAKTTLNVTTEIWILKTKAFKAINGSSESGGRYNYFQDHVLINKDVA